MDNRPTLDQIFGKGGTSNAPTSTSTVTTPPASSNPSLPPQQTDPNGRPSLDSIFAGTPPISSSNWQPKAQTPPQKTPLYQNGFNLKDFGTDLKQGVLGSAMDGLGNIFSKRFQNAKDIANEPSETPPSGVPALDATNNFLSKTLHQVGNVAAGGRDIIEGATKPIFAPLMKGINRLGQKDQEVGSAIGSTARNIVGADNADAIGAKGNSIVQGAVDTAKKVYNSPAMALNRPVIEGITHTLKDPVVQRSLGDVGNVAALAGDVVGAKDLFEAAPEAFKGIADRAGEAKTAIGDVVKTHIIEPQQAKAVDQLESDYSKWAGNTKPGVKNVGKAEARTEALNSAGTTGRTPQRTLAESGVIPETEGTKFRTADQAQQYRDSLKPLNEAQQSAIKEVEQATQKIKTSDLEQSAIDRVRTPENIANGKADKLETEIRKEFDGYRKNYGEELPLSTVDDIKSARWKDTKFDFTQPLKSDTNYAIAKAAQKTIESTANQAGFTDLAQLNREIGDRLEASKFLESLDGQTLKGGKIGKYALSIAGASLGTTLTGKIAGYVGGDILGDILMSADVANPVKRLLLKSLSEKDPEAYQATLEWIKKQGFERDTRLALPAGGKSSTANVMPMKGTVPYEGDGQAENINYAKPPEKLYLPPGKTKGVQIPIELPAKGQAASETGADQEFRDASYGNKYRNSNYSTDSKKPIFPIKR